MKFTCIASADKFPGELTPNSDYVCAGVFPGTNHFTRKPELGALIFNDKEQWSIYPLLAFKPKEESKLIGL